MIIVSCFIFLNGSYLTHYIGFMCVIALLGGRSTRIYKELFSILTHHASRLGLTFRPEKITTDFEAALIKMLAEEVSFFLFLSI